MVEKNEFTPRIFEAAQLFDDAVMTGTLLNEYGKVKEPDFLHDIIGKQLRDLHKRAGRLKGIDVVYSGIGFVPVADEDGDVVTAYSRVENATGTFSGIYISDSSDIQYVKPSQVEIDDEDLVDSNIDLLSKGELEIVEFKKLLHEAPPGFRLLIEFVVREETEVDQPIRGHAVRVPAYTVYNIMDAASLEIVDIDEKPKGRKFGVDEIKPALIVFSKHYRQQIQNKNFRKKTLRTQQKIIDTFFERCNSILELDRFSMASSASILFLPDASSPSGFEQVFSSIPFIGEPVRFDCVEAKLLGTEQMPIRKRKGNFNSFVSTCVVVEIDEENMEGLDVETNIIWVPVMNQLHVMEFVELEIV